MPAPGTLPPSSYLRLPTQALSARGKRRNTSASSGNFHDINRHSALTHKGSGYWSWPRTSAQIWIKPDQPPAFCDSGQAGARPGDCLRGCLMNHHLINNASNNILLKCDKDVITQIICSCLRFQIGCIFISWQGVTIWRKYFLQHCFSYNYFER